MNRYNPYEAPRTVANETQNVYSLTHRSLLRLVAIPLVGLNCWSIYFVSPIGIILPAAIGWAFATRFAGTFPTALLAIVLAYVVGVFAIVCADLVTNAYDPLLLNNDALVPVVTRIWAATGILGALIGAAIGVFLASPKADQNRAEP